MKNLNDNQLDDLFKSKFPVENYKSHLAQEYKEKQWKKLARNLYGHKNNRLFLMFLFGLFTIVGFGWIGYNTLGFEDHTKVLSESNNLKNVVLSSNNNIANNTSKETLLHDEQITSTNTSLVTKNEELSKTNVLSIKNSNKKAVKNSSIARINKMESVVSKEICNCPDDYMNTKDDLNISKIAEVIEPYTHQENTSSDPDFSLAKSSNIDILTAIDNLTKLNQKIKHKNENKLFLNPKFASEIEPKNKSSITFDISMGVYKDYFLDSTISDTTSVSYYVSAGIALNRKTAFKIEYNEQNIQRGFGYEAFGPKSLGIYTPNIDSTLSQASARYKVRSIELSLTRHLISIYNIDIMLNPGLQLSNNSEGDITLEFDRIYGSEINNYKIDTAPLRLNNAFIDASLRYPISQTLGFQFAYKRYFSLKEQILPWTQRNRLSAGITFSF